MPTQTFFNLKEAKQQKLEAAAVAEFSRVPLDQASIAKIVKHAAISRGSFYQYFENKEDLFYYLLEKQTAARQEIFMEALKDTDGDLFEAMAALFQSIIKERNGQNYFRFLKNALLTNTHEMESGFTMIFNGKQKEELLLEEIVSHINKENLRLSDSISLFHVMEILTSVTFRNVVDKFTRHLSDEEASRNLDKQLNLLKNGLYK